METFAAKKASASRWGEIKGVAALNGTPKKAARDAGEIKRVLIKEDEELKASLGCTPIVLSSAVALK